MTSYTIGFRRKNGDFAILSTFNNHDGLIPNYLLEKLKNDTVYHLKQHGLCNVEAIERQDAPYYVNLEEGSDVPNQ